MERISITFNGTAQRVALNGREYLVAPATMLREGVLNGSQGPLFYPREEIHKDASAWNGMPLLLGHPMTPQGEHISGRTPDVWNNRLLGHVFHAQASDGKLTAEAWFDAGAVKNVAPQLLTLLREGKPVEVSTGLFTETRPPDVANATYNGEPYEGVAYAYKPDHLAVLLDEKGACSNEDGCGINVVNDGEVSGEKACQIVKDGEVNGQPLSEAQQGYFGARCGEVRNTEEANMNRTKLLQWLTANCACWKKDPSKIEAMSDKELTELKANTEKVNRLILIVNGARKKNAANQGDAEGEVAGVDPVAVAELFGITIDPGKDPAGFMKGLLDAMDAFRSQLTGEAAPTEPAAPEPAAAAEGDMPPDDEKEPMAMAEGDDLPPDQNPPVAAAAAHNRRDKPMTMQQYLASVPPQFRAIVNSALKRDREERRALLTRIVANLEGERRKARWNKHVNDDLEDLRELADMVNPLPEERVPLYLGAGGGPIGNARTFTEEDQEEIEAMIPPVMNFREKRA